MKKLNDGGPAFPQPQGTDPHGSPYSAREVDGDSGMTLRDWFAGMALGHIPALLDVTDENASCENIAGHAYQIADAMLIARKQKTEP